jgi:uncharacterized membrane protein (DUF2068 family)
MSSPAQRGLRLIATFEASKGLLVLLAGFGLLSLLHRDIQPIAENIVSHFHLNPASHYPRVFLQLAGNMTDTKLWLMAGFSLTYSSIRLAEAYGLWWALRWAEWLAVLSGGLYVPIEIYELLSGFSWIKTCTLIANICIVIYMAYVLKQGNQNNHASQLS